MLVDGGQVSRVWADDRILIINADDFGFTDGVNLGIVEAHRAGTVTSASLMVNTPGFAGAVAAMHELPELRVGLHINLTVGRPLSGRLAASLVDPESGRFLSLARLLGRAMGRRVLYRHVYDEVHAQFARATDSGIALTHMDGHEHVHLLPVVASAVRDIAPRFGVSRIRAPFESLRHRPWRLRATSVKIALRLAALAGQLSTPQLREPRNVRQTSRAVRVRGISLQGGGAFSERLQHDLQSLPLGTTELIVHPGYVDATLADLDNYLAPREIERAALTSEIVRSLLRSLPIRLATFATL